MSTPTTRKKTPPWRYRILLRTLSPILLGYTLWKTIKGGDWRYLYERLGLYRFSILETHADNNKLWVHAASVGEVITVLPLVKSWLATVDKGQVLFTTGTPTGCEVLNKQDINGITHQYLPIDFPGACRRFFQQADVSQGWIVETEIWPWLYSTCHQTGVKLTIINGRLSDKTSKQSTGFLASSYHQVISDVQILARTAEDARRFISLGAKGDNVKIAGDLKYATGNARPDIEPFIKQPFVLAASTHADEELCLAEAWRQTKKGNVLLVIAPRHPERSATVCNDLVKKGFRVALHSIDNSPSAEHEIYIVDTLGELPLLYRYAVGAFVGGSLIERGGHNIIEPAQFACPTVVGPHTFNFSDMVARLKSNNAIEIALTASDVADFLVSASEGSIAQQDMGKRAQAVADVDRQATLENYQKLLF
ncbi:MAG: 3-deoxy-D-manno-octulosonic-acid transferase [Pseudomonadales bacterium]|jgi:3-deoxy-D-manno-octulosonic-acid transferase